MNSIKDLSKFIKLTGERAKLDAKANSTYIVYKTREGHFVKEYSNGQIEQLKEQDLHHE
ncbi:hypothetical protein PUW24_01395 [Paenibacillus urinalis]|uniref:Uncharacterized protein n=1 Tax=Paenibacillus urinalis TaxID=521520 RepID=A0AAX3MWC6_9BACL|nr:hypothetical protein [Paenibacillus urinalis]WDH81642.1 hypothetical protein PUW23_19285 [Paenibacillus urinalis]WDH97684.1 hypothetical protein PUW24_01395 [Paenibacillus urinalis]WDI01360.1 hypothetical protein PUW25_19130 [Paenibacillus urinalis]